MKLPDEERRLLQLVGERIRVRRRNRGLTQKDLYILTGVQIKLISEVENGNHNPKFSVIQRLATFLELSMIELMSEETDPDTCAEGDNSTKRKELAGDTELSNMVNMLRSLSPEYVEHIKATIYMCADAQRAKGL